MLKSVLRVLNITLIILGCLSIYLYVEENNIVDEIWSYYTKEYSTIVTNEYGINKENNYFQKSDNFKPQTRLDLLNIYYTVISSDSDSFTFYCPNDYSSCIEDIKGITNDSSLLSHINNFVHPLNSYKRVKTTYSNFGKITISVIRLYSDKKKELINNKIDELYSILVSSNRSSTENIKKVHDYIVNNVTYDTSYEQGNSIHESNTAYGALFEGYAVCSGYTDLMSIFLNKMGINNYKVSNDTHIWNLVYLDGKWLHLDATFDDPVSSNGKNYLSHDYFLISTDKLKELDKKDNKNSHVFNEEIYLLQ